MRKHRQNFSFCGRIAIFLQLAGIDAGCEQSAPMANPAAIESSAMNSANRNAPVPVASAVGSAKRMQGGSPEYRRGYDEGVSQAEDEFANHKATIYVQGTDAIGEKLDEDTGLNSTWIAGCFQSDFILGRAEGHNERLEELIDLHGIPSYSRKKWEDVLFALSNYFSARS